MVLWLWRKRSTLAFLVLLILVIAFIYRYWTTVIHAGTTDLTLSQKMKLQERRIGLQGERAGMWTRHIWFNICGNLLYSLKKHLNFPLQPDQEMVIRSLSITTSKKFTNFGERIFGYIHPYTTGHYQFVLSAYDTSELWISSNDDPYNVVLHSFIRQWKGPGMYEFKDIPANSLSLYDGTGNKGRNIAWKRNDIPVDLPSTFLIVPTQVFPRDNTWIADFRRTSAGNKEIQLFEVELNRSKDIEKYGSRTVRISQYVYRYLRNQSRLCLPEGMHWNRHADVYAIVCVYNQGIWVKHFIKQMAQFQKQAKGYTLHVIIVDHHSTDANMTELMLDSELKSYTLIQRQGIFWKTAAIQAAIETIKDPHSIVLMLDLHLYFPSDFIDIIRKHTVEGKLAAAPILIRLHCGYSRKELNGFWETEGLGILGIFKSDLDRIGGMNTRDYESKWGGEDVELVDRAVGFGLEIYRIKVPRFYHQYHSRKGMWDKNSLPTVL
ncbi:Beta-1,4-N-acetylgalactosaminyltransferase 3 [Trichoplax sp. H2]|nr:Beta-1,4-N-acetylgalactosaminyltransferase 3 [Trichoplax sp. H2]|eukprot:RDD46294.1 Beta-1,4-N-acetylgalactosaminyltransferase 3 [Trichoplax sp. H2]